MKPTVFEQGDHLYVVSKVVEAAPVASAIEEYAFGKDIIAGLRAKAPNEHLAWFGGHYVEGGSANRNGAMFLSEELAIKSLTPVFCPVTVMHDPRTAVGLIADIRLSMSPEVQRSKIETALALWKHRFPEAVAEASLNCQQGTLMQSMEAIAPMYDCSVCGESFHKLPKGAEEANWCEHLKGSRPTGGYNAVRSGENSNASRILRGVTFTGTGLIFGTRGGIGADPEANLDAFQEEVAEFHAKQHRDTSQKKPRPKRSHKRMAEIDDREYAELLAAKQERDTLQTKVTGLEASASQVPDLEKKVTTLEAEKGTEKERADAAEAKVKAAEEKANQQSLRDQRWEALGSGFTHKLDSMPTTKARLLSDAASMEDAAWDTRLKEVEEATGIERKADKEGGSSNEGENGSKDNPVFSKEEVASFKGGGGGENQRTNVQTPSERRSVVGGLVRPPKKS
jgi:hypothetical protein